MSAKKQPPPSPLRNGAARRPPPPLATPASALAEPADSSAARGSGGGTVFAKIAAGIGIGLVLVTLIGGGAALAVRGMKRSNQQVSVAPPAPIQPKITDAPSAKATSQPASPARVPVESNPLTRTDATPAAAAPEAPAPAAELNVPP
jgi:hypothetical protein